MPVPPFPDTPRGEITQKFHVRDWKGANTESPRSAIEDGEFSWVENYISLAPGNLRTLYAENTAIYTTPAGLTIIYSLSFNIGGIALFAVFLSDGTAVQVNAATGATTTISANVGTFYAGGFLPAAAQWNSAGIIIVDEANNPDGYRAWDGVTLYTPGVAAPDWLTNITPTVMPSGIHGSAVEVYQNRAWVTKPPSAGIGTVLTNGAPGNGADFSGPSGGGSTPQQDSSLRYTYTALKQSNGFLYAFGDSAVTVISNVQTTGTPPVTTFNNQNVDPQIGTPWRDTVQSFGQGIVFANTQGVFLLAGGTVKKISKKINPVFTNIDTSFTPTAAIATMYGVRVYMLLLRSRDQTGALRPFMCLWNGQEWFFASQVTTLAAIYPQEANSVMKAWGTGGTTLFQMFGTASTSLTKTLQSKFFSGGDGDDGWITFKKQYRFFFELFDYSGAGVTFTGTMDSDFANASLNVSSLTAVNNSQGILQPQNAGNQNIYAVTFGLIAASVGYFEFANASSFGPSFGGSFGPGAGIIHFTNSTGGVILWGVMAISANEVNIANYGRLLGCTLGTTASDYSLIAYMIQFSYDTAMP